VVGIFLGQREQQIEVDRLELIGTQRGAVFAVHRPEVWEVAGVEIRGAMHHAVEIDDGRIRRIADYADPAEALAAAGAGGG
jgi:hypothetical protein